MCGSGRYDSLQTHLGTDTALSAKNVICAIETSKLGTLTFAPTVFASFATNTVYLCHGAYNAQAANRDGGHEMS